MNGSRFLKNNVQNDFYTEGVLLILQITQNPYFRRQNAQLRKVFRLIKTAFAPLKPVVSRGTKYFVQHKVGD